MTEGVQTKEYASGVGAFCKYFFAGIPCQRNATLDLRNGLRPFQNTWKSSEYLYYVYLGSPKNKQMYSVTFPSQLSQKIIQLHALSPLTLPTMDHVPKPIDGDRRPPLHFYAERRIGGVYHPEDFHELPKQYECDDLEKLLDEGLPSHLSNTQAHQFLQSWLMFSLLARVLGKDINITHYETRDTNLLNTEYLAKELEQWAEDQSQAETEDALHHQKRQYVKASMALDSARRFVWKHLSWKPTDREDTTDADDLQSVGSHNTTRSIHNIDDVLSLSIASIGEILQEELWSRFPAYRKDTVLFCQRPDQEERRWGNTKWCRKKMQDNKWCPLDIRRLEATMSSVNSVFYACQIDRDLPGREQEMDHEKAGCTEWECKVTRTKRLKEIQGYHLHNDDDTTCKKQWITDEKLCSIINEGKIPLVKWTGRGELTCEGYSLDGVDSIPVFGALSHSWSESIVHCGQDSRGKPDMCMLRCQLSKLRDTFSRIFSLPPGSDPLFWVDVLCIPTNYTAKIIAISQLSKVYSTAEAVLVWDRNLLGRPKPAREDYIEINVRLRTGEWSSRLWTLPEAILAQNLFIAFQDWYLGIDKIAEVRHEAKFNLKDAFHYVWRAGQPFSSAIWHLRQKDEFPVQRTWQELQFRLGSKNDDETIVLSTILGLDFTELLEMKARTGENLATSRMAKFLDTLEATIGIPAGMPFLSVPKLVALDTQSLDRYGWAPASWMTKQVDCSSLFRPVHQRTHMMPYGLHVKFGGIILHFPRDMKLGTTFWVPVNQSLHKWFKVKVEIPEHEWRDLWEDQVCHSNEPSIILNSNNPRERWEIGLLVQHKGKLASGEVRWVRSFCRVWVRLETSTNVIKERKRVFNETGQNIIFGERLRDQRWCIQS